MKTLRRLGFTLIELVLVILLVGILAAVAIPNFIDFRSDAKDGAVQAALGGLRSAVAIARAAIALREATTAPFYPTVTEFWTNAFNASHPILSGQAIMDPSAGIPKNPWTVSTAGANAFNSIYDCTATSKPSILSGGTTGQQGWCYFNATGSSGIFWANSSSNGATSFQKTENNY